MTKQDFLFQVYRMASNPEKTPWWMGVAYQDPDVEMFVMAVYPVNWVIRGYRWLKLKFLGFMQTLKAK
jgi:hypothetical protein